MKKISISILLIFSSIVSFSQELLTLHDAVELGLKNNYDISLVKNQSEITSNDATRGNSGMLPQISINASRSLSDNNTKQEYSNGTSLKKSGAASNNTAAGIVLAWTLFDGMKMFATHDRLRELKAMGELNAKIQIENTIEQIICAYYFIVQQKQLLAAIDTTMAVYRERTEIAKEKWNLGNGSKSDFLQAQIDQNEQKSLRLRQYNNLLLEKIKLNELLGRKPETAFDVTEEIDLTHEFIPADDVNQALSKNNSILFYNRNISAAEYSIKEKKAGRWPVLTLNSSYNFSRTENQAGFFLLNQNLGFNAGLSASWVLFSGYTVNRQIKNSQISLLNSKLMLEKAKSQAESELKAAFNNYSATMEELTLERENMALAKENTIIMLERFRLGNANSLDIKIAQKSYSDAISRNLQASFNAKVAETRLMKLRGELVK